MAHPDPEPGPVPGYVAPRTPMERQLTDFMEDLLGAGQVGVLDDFFELGGFSLLATQLATRVRDTFGVELSLRNIFDARTVYGMAQLILLKQLLLSGNDDLEALLADLQRQASEPGLT